MTELSFPRQQARTRRFGLGVPRSFLVAPDGGRVLFLRTRSGTDSTGCLYESSIRDSPDATAWDCRLVVDPAVLMSGDLESLPAEERARRERARETGGGIVRFSCDDELKVAAFDLAGRLFVVELVTGQVRELPARSPVVDPRPDPTGRLVAYVSAGDLRLIDVGGSNDRGVLETDDQQVTFGLAEFVAGEEMGRQQGYWWSPDGTTLLAARVDNHGVERRYISDPSTPTAPPQAIAYPAAGTPNADVTLEVVKLAPEPAGSGGLGDDRTPVSWDRAELEYVVAADWSRHGLLLVVESRDQRRLQLLEVDEISGETRVVREETDARWVDIVDGVPRRLGDGTVIWVATSQGVKALFAGDVAVTGAELRVRSVLGVDSDAVVFTASRSDDPSAILAFSWSAANGVEHLGPGPAGVEAAWQAGGTTVLARSDLETAGTVITVLRGGRVTGTIASVAETPVITPKVQLARVGTRQLSTGVLFPTGHERGSALLPVLLDPYGGPHFQRVVATSQRWLESQWWADQGFCVVVTDGRGTPGRDDDFERSIYRDVAGPVLEDQVDALHDLADRHADMDLARVAIRGWSFGGYLAALAVLRRPDVFHAAVAGAPPTDWRLYDTHYTERYLGRPQEDPAAYDATSLLNEAHRLERPLLLIHGMADDNVTVANTLRLSQALLAGGRPHSSLLLSGVTHMTPQEEVAENLLLLELDFLRQALTDPAPGRQPADGAGHVEGAL
jgi:dipeptidyl-peptidase-4